MEIIDFMVSIMNVIKVKNPFKGMPMAKTVSAIRNNKILNEIVTLSIWSGIFILLHWGGGRFTSWGPYNDIRFTPYYEI